MNAENILLTHFSARYPKMPPTGMPSAESKVSESLAAGRQEPVVALAFDNANLTIGNMWKLNFYLPAVEQTFKDTACEVEEEEEDITAVMEVNVPA